MSFFTKIFKKNEYKSEEFEKEEISSSDEIIVLSPLKGRIIPLSQVADEVFSQGIMGKGVAIAPDEGIVCSPVTGRVSFIYPTKHAMGLIGNNNVEVLIHIGMDTVKLNGKYYKSHVKEGDMVKAGEIILEFDMNKIQSAGYEVMTPVIITNSNNYSDIKVTDSASVNVKDVLLTLVR